MNQSLPEELENQGFDLLQNFSEQLAELLGKTNRNYSSVVLLYSNAGPTIELENDHAKLILGPNAIHYEPTFVANLAHESVHLFEGTYGNASGFEEGFAVFFELSVIESMYGKSEREHHIRHLPSSYAKALDDYTQLIENFGNPAKIIHQKYGRLSGITLFQFREVFPNISWFKAFRFARRKQMR